MAQKTVTIGGIKLLPPDSSGADLGAIMEKGQAASQSSGKTVNIGGIKLKAPVKLDPSELTPVPNGLTPETPSSNDSIVQGVSKGVGRAVQELGTGIISGAAGLVGGVAQGARNIGDALIHGADYKGDYNQMSMGDRFMQVQADVAQRMEALNPEDKSMANNAAYTLTKGAILAAPEAIGWLTGEAASKGVKGVAGAANYVSEAAGGAPVYTQDENGDQMVRAWGQMLVPEIAGKGAKALASPGAKAFVSDVKSGAGTIINKALMASDEIPGVNAGTLDRPASVGFRDLTPTEKANRDTAQALKKEIWQNRKDAVAGAGKSLVENYPEVIGGALGTAVGDLTGTVGGAIAGHLVKTYMSKVKADKLTSEAITKDSIAAAEKSANKMSLDADNIIREYGHVPGFNDAGPLSVANMTKSAYESQQARILKGEKISPDELIDRTEVEEAARLADKFISNGNVSARLSNDGLFYPSKESIRKANDARDAELAHQKALDEGLQPLGMEEPKTGKVYSSVGAFKNMVDSLSNKQQEFTPKAPPKVEPTPVVRQPSPEQIAERKTKAGQLMEAINRRQGRVETPVVSTEAVKSADARQARIDALPEYDKNNVPAVDGVKMSKSNINRIIRGEDSIDGVKITDAHYEAATDYMSKWNMQTPGGLDRVSQYKLMKDMESKGVEQLPNTSAGGFAQRAAETIKGESPKEVSKQPTSPLTIAPKPEIKPAPPASPPPVKPITEAPKPHAEKVAEESVAESAPAEAPDKPVKIDYREVEEAAKDLPIPEGAIPEVMQHYHSLFRSAATLIPEFKDVSKANYFKNHNDVYVANLGALFKGISDERYAEIITQIEKNNKKIQQKIINDEIAPYAKNGLKKTDFSDEINALKRNIPGETKFTKNANWTPEELKKEQRRFIAENTFHLNDEFLTGPVYRFAQEAKWDEITPLSEIRERIKREAEYKLKKLERNKSKE